MFKQRKCANRYLAIIVAATVIFIMRNHVDRGQVYRTCPIPSSQPPHLRFAALLDNIWNAYNREQNRNFSRETDSKMYKNGVLTRYVNDLLSNSNNSGSIITNNRSLALLYLAEEVKHREHAARSRRLNEDVFTNERFTHLTRQIEKINRTQQVVKKPTTYYKLHNVTENTALQPWQMFENSISRNGLYSQSDEHIISQLLRDLRTVPITSLKEMPDRGTQSKFVFTLQDGSRALFKPKRVPRDYEVPMDTYYFHEFERHYAEIAAFHLDKVLGFYRVPPVAGRVINLEEDIRKRASYKLRFTFSYSPINNLCFYGVCDYFCDKRHSICGNGVMLEGSMAAYLPSSLKITSEDNPWRRSYSRKRQAEWQLYEHTYCDIAKVEFELDSGRRLLDIIDLHIFDFLTGNQDRHSLYNFNDEHEDSFLIAFDNGRAFGRPGFDDMAILAPLKQCCVIRSSTLNTLMTFEKGPVWLSTAVRNSLRAVPLEPVLTERHLLALDRRLKIILNTVYECLQVHEAADIIHDDGL